MKQRVPAALLVFVAAVFAVAVATPHGKDAWLVPAEAKKLKNPVPPGEATLNTAKLLYEDKCAQCHGEKGKGDGPESIMYSPKPEDLTNAQMMNAMTDGEIFWKIGEGREPMPSFKRQLTEEQRWQLVRFLRSLVSKPAKTAPAKKSPPHKH